MKRKKKDEKDESPNKMNEKSLEGWDFSRYLGGGNKKTPDLSCLDSYLN